jgi:hypothetical protein
VKWTEKIFARKFENLWARIGLLGQTGQMLGIQTMRLDFLLRLFRQHSIATQAEGTPQTHLLQEDLTKNLASQRGSVTDRSDALVRYGEEIPAAAERLRPDQEERLMYAFRVAGCTESCREKWPLDSAHF